MEIQEPCPECSKMMTVSFGQRIVNHRLVAYISSHCPHCGLATEEDDFDGYLPEHLRKLLIAHEGEWSITIEPLNVYAMHEIGARFNLLLNEMMTIKNRDNKYTHCGTKTEIDYYKAFFDWGSTHSYFTVTVEKCVR